MFFNKKLMLPLGMLAIFELFRRFFLFYNRSSEAHETIMDITLLVFVITVLYFFLIGAYYAKKRDGILSLVLGFFFLCFLGLLLGSLFRFPIAWIMILTYCMLAIFFICIIFFSEHKIFQYLMSSAILLILIGELCKSFHWPGAIIYLSLGYSVLLVLYILKFYRKTVKSTVNVLKLMLIVIFCFFTILYQVGLFPIKIGFMYASIIEPILIFLFTYLYLATTNLDIPIKKLKPLIEEMED